MPDQLSASAAPAVAGTPPALTEILPVVVARATAIGSGQSSTPPALTRLGGVRVVDRLLTTLAEAGLAAPVVVAEHEAAEQLRRAPDAPYRPSAVLGAPADRLSQLREAVAGSSAPYVLIHDAERALTPLSVLREVIGAMVGGADAVVPTVAMTDSVKELHPQGMRNVDRTTLAGIQSPRLLRRELLDAVLAADADGTLGAADEILGALALDADIRTVHGSHAGFAVVDRLTLWRAQITLGLARDTSGRDEMTRQR